VHSSIGDFRDLRTAAVIGGGAEALLTLRVFKAGSELLGHHPWLDILQTPGALVAERLFRHSGVLQAMTCTFLIQGTIFTLVTLGVVYICRLLRLKLRQH
jgi:hypothetical protein